MKCLHAVVVGLLQSAFADLHADLSFCVRFGATCALRLFVFSSVFIEADGNGGDGSCS